jgi:hypothetical protein
MSRFLPRQALGNADLCFESSREALITILAGVLSLYERSTESGLRPALQAPEMSEPGDWICNQGLAMVRLLFRIRDGVHAMVRGVDSPDIIK